MPRLSTPRLPAASVDPDKGRVCPLEPAGMVRAVEPGVEARGASMSRSNHVWNTIPYMDGLGIVFFKLNSRSRPGGPGVEKHT